MSKVRYDLQKTVTMRELTNALARASIKYELDDSQLGHSARSKHAFIITLGTPTDGSDYEALAGWIKRAQQVQSSRLNFLA